MAEIPASSPAPAQPPASTPAATAKSAPAGPEPRPQITIEDFAKIELRVARVLKAEAHPSADKLLKLQLDDGSGQPRQICAGIREHYQPEDLVDKLIVIVANLAPRMLRGEESRGMLLAASDVPKADAPPGAKRHVKIITVAGDIPPGSLVG